MKKKPHQRIDVSIFNEILKNKHCPEDDKESTKKVLLETIKKVYRVEIDIPGLDIDKKIELNKIDIREYGFKDKNDVIIEFVQDVFESKTKIILIPKTIYELEDKIELPIAINNKGKLYLAFMSDTFERLKVKAENIISETEETKHIELYAKKNIQMSQRIFYDARMVLNKMQSEGTKTEIFIVFVQNVFLINVILYLQKMFSAFYHEKLLTRKSLKTELYDSVGMNIFMEPVSEYGNVKKEAAPIEKERQLKWNGQVNVLATFFYDALNEKIGNKKMLLEADIEDIKYLLNKYFIDKNGNAISKETIRTCLSEYRDEKRAKGNKRIDISKYSSLD